MLHPRPLLIIAIDLLNPSQPPDQCIDKNETGNMLFKHVNKLKRKQYWNGKKTGRGESNEQATAVSPDIPPGFGPRFAAVQKINPHISPGLIKRARGPTAFKTFVYC